MEVILKDGSKLKLDEGANVYDAAKAISDGLARNALCGKADGQLVDLKTVLSDGQTVEIVTFQSDEGKAVYRHTAAHILAQAVKNIYPTVKLAIGPSIAAGFYYDFDFKTPVTREDFDKIETEMQKIIKADLPIERMELSREEALKYMREKGEIYKIELIEELPADEKISFYKQGDFVDFCRGPHLSSTGKVKAFKLTNLAGAYWRGNENNKMLSRIYGTAFDKKADLDAYLAAVEEAKRRDHNKVGREMGFFMTDENIGQGLALLMPKGAKIVQLLQRFVEDEEEKRGYVFTKTPLLSKSNLFKISGHWDHYRDKMFIIGDESKGEEVYALRPMTCPFQYTIYKNGLKSYRDLPIRYSETSTLFRKEASGEMHGLIRLRQFTLADGHIICRPDQVEQEFRGALELVTYIAEVLGISDDLTYRFSKWDPANTDKYIDNPEGWEQSQRLMKMILDHLKLEYIEADGEAAFYGPKLDVQFTNVYGKEDTLFTIQIDFELAHRFDMTYVDVNGEKQYPYIVHRSSIGCYERTLAMLIEKYNGAFPLWLSPTQIKVMSLTDRTAQHALDTVDKLRRLGFRAEADTRGEKIGYKIREAQVDKIPYMFIIGDKEATEGGVSVRSRRDGDLGAMTLEAAAEKLKKEVDSKAF